MKRVSSAWREWPFQRQPAGEELVALPAEQDRGLGIFLNLDLGKNNKDLKK